MRLRRWGRGRVEVVSVLPPKEEVEGESERLVWKGTRSVDAVEGGGLSGVVSNGGLADGSMAVVGRGGGGIILVVFLFLEMVEKSFHFEESCGRGDKFAVIDRCEAD